MRALKVIVLTSVIMIGIPHTDLDLKSGIGLVVVGLASPFNLNDALQIGDFEVGEEVLTVPT